MLIGCGLKTAGVCFVETAESSASVPLKWGREGRSAWLCLVCGDQGLQYIATEGHRTADGLHAGGSADHITFVIAHRSLAWSTR